MNELYERHFLSELFLGLVFGGVNGFRLCGSLHADQWGAAALHVMDDAPDAWVVARHDQSGLHFVCVIEKIQGSDRKLARIGSGVSTSATHAVERAISEYIQSVVLTDESTEEEDQRIIRFLEGSSKLRHLLACSAVEHLPQGYLKMEAEGTSTGTRSIVELLIRQVLVPERTFVRFSEIGVHGCTICQ